MEPIISLASSWQKVEFQRWPTLLDEVQDQYELNARKVGRVRKFYFMNKNNVKGNTFFFLVAVVASFVFSSVSEGWC